VLLDVSLTPVEMLVETGNDLEVQCTLSGDLRAARVNASMLHVSLPPSNNVVRTVVDERTLKVVFRSLHRNVSHHQVFCQLPGYQKYAQSTVVVAGLSWFYYAAVVIGRITCLACLSLSVCLVTCF